MTCTHIEDLLPLIISGDLPTKKADSVRAHLYACQNCSDAAAEYEASQLWLASASEGDFDDHFYTDLRDSVLIKIRQTPAAPRFSWNWVFAMVVIVLLASAGLLIALRRTPQGTEVASNQPGKPRSAAGPDPSTHDRTNIDAHTSSGAGLPNRLAPTGRASRTQTFKVNAVASLPVRSKSDRETLGHQRLAMVPSTLRGTGAAMRPMVAASILSLGDEGAPRLSRIEIQTSDPSVKIIWLVASRETEEAVDFEIDD